MLLLLLVHLRVAPASLAPSSPLLSISPVLTDMFPIQLQERAELEQTDRQIEEKRHGVRRTFNSTKTK